MISKKVLPVAAVCVMAMSTPAFSAGKWECAEFLCIVSGFLGENCDKAHTAMVKRILRFKSPVPSFSSCSSNNRNDEGIAIKEETMALYYPKLPDGARMGSWLPEPDLKKAETTKLFEMDRSCPAETVHLNTEPWICVKSFEAVSITRNGAVTGNTVFTSSERKVNLIDPYDYVRDNETGIITIVVDDNGVPLETITEERLLEANSEVQDGLVEEDTVGYESEGENVVDFATSGFETAISEDPAGMEAISGELPDYSDKELSNYSTEDGLNNTMSGYTDVEVPDYSETQVYSAEDWAAQSSDSLIENNSGDLYTQLPEYSDEMFSDELSNEAPDYSVDGVDGYLNGGLKSE